MKLQEKFAGEARRVRRRSGKWEFLHSLLSSCISFDTHQWIAPKLILTKFYSYSKYGSAFFCKNYKCKMNFKKSKNCVLVS